MIPGSSGASSQEGGGGDDDCDIVTPTKCAPGEMPPWIDKLNELQEKGLGSVVLLAATFLSLTLANCGATSAAWLSFWSSPVGPRIGGHALSLQGWTNEGLMAIFFFVVGLEIKLELRHGSLSSVRKALLPCIAALGGMLTPMAVYAATVTLLGGGSLAALTVPMGTDIAFAMAIFGFFRAKMPASAATFLLTLATVDDLGAILVLATCFAHDIRPAFLGAALTLISGMGLLGRKQSTSKAAYGVGGAALWWCLLRAGVSADIAGVAVALCISTKALKTGRGKGAGEESSNSSSSSSSTLAEGAEEEEEEGEPWSERLITLLSPLSTFFIMPAFALANTAVPLGGSLLAGMKGAAAQHGAVAPAAGISAGLLLGKPLGIFGATLLATKVGVAPLPPGMTKRHLGVIGMLGGIGFTMCLLLTEVAMPPVYRPVPKLAVLVSSGLACVASAAAMWRLKPRNEAGSGGRGSFEETVGENALAQ